MRGAEKAGKRGGTRGPIMVVMGMLLQCSSGGQTRTFAPLDVHIYAFMKKIIKVVVEL